MSFVSALSAEIADLETDIKVNPDPRFKKLEDLKRIHAAYYAASDVHVAKPSGNLSGRTAAEIAQSIQERDEPVETKDFYESFGSERASFGTAVVRMARAPGRKRSPEREQALREAELFLNGKTVPVKTAEIYGMLQFKGIQITGEDPKSNLSAMLSNAPQFESHGRDGWTLAGGVFS
jgi:hypothetical protein